MKFNLNLFKLNFYSEKQIRRLMLSEKFIKIAIPELRNPAY